MQHIETVTVGSGGAASITFSAIPQTYTDLQILYSTRQTSASYAFIDTIAINGDELNQTIRRLRGNSSNAATSTSGFIILNGSSATANTFDNGLIYIPNYAKTDAYKSLSSDSVSESNGGADEAFQFITAMLWSDNSAITSIGFVPASNFVEGTSISLYGITAGSDGIVAVS